MLEAKYESFNFYKSEVDDIHAFKDKDKRYECMISIIKYGLGIEDKAPEDPEARAIFERAKAKIDADRK